jgi:tetratricopeptide (TPR) repeat protein
MIGRSSQALRASTVDPPVEGLLVNGRYRVERQLGRGGAASVFKALDVSTGRQVALKRLVEKASPRLCSLFELEYHTLSSVKHKNIVEVYDYGADAHGPYYVMELLEGQDLSHQRKPDWRKAAHDASEVASALSALHQRRLVHRDVSARNVWCLPDGNLKLIDFGALTGFGTCGDVVGTPPHVAPEALQSRPVDQRTDLYALGALLYWQLTGTHAYPARTLRELPRLWAQPAVSVLEQLERLGHSAGDLPRELDALVMALLSENPLARPTTTGEVIDRLSAVLGRLPEQRSGAQDIDFSQPGLMGRERERKEWKRQLEQLALGHGEATLFAAKAGDGRTRLLNELAVDARIFGAHVIHVHAKSCSGTHGLADAIVQRLLDGLPEAARAAAHEHANVLGHLSRSVEQRLAVPLKQMPAVAGEARANIHEALSAFLNAVSKHSPLVVLVDDLEGADESSTAWLATFASRAIETRVLLGLAIEDSNDSDRSLAIRALRQHARRVALKSLTAPETHKLIASLFGEVPYLVRMSERLFRITQGNPARIVELSRHLVREGVITNIDGTWVLPQELPEEQLALDGEKRAQVAIGRLSSDGKTLGAALSVRRGPLPIELCKALSDLPSARLFGALEELCREGILSSSSIGYHFEDELLRTGMRVLLGQDEAQRCHMRLGAFLLSDPNAPRLTVLGGLVHAMEGGDLVGASDRIARLTLDLVTAEPDTTVEAAPLLEQALKLFRAAGRREFEFAPLLASLAVAGFFSDRRLSARYGERALNAIDRALRVDLMHKLRPWLGRKLSLLIGLFVAKVSLRRRPLPGAPSMKEIIQLYFYCAGTISGVNTICIDPDAVLRCAARFEPFTALGKGHVATFMYEFNTNLAMTVQDRFAEGCERWKAAIARLENPQDLAGFPEMLRMRYLAGALYAYGVLECWRDSPVALTIAERLDGFGLKLYQMSADQLRSVYYAHQGNRELYEHYRNRAEQHAIQRGSAWQIETWAPGAAVTFYLRTADAMGLKESHEQLGRLEKRIPALSVVTQRARGAFLFLRRRYEEALPLMEECLSEPPLGVIGWARAHGGLAACLNRLGQHERAREICRVALDRLSAGDLDFPGMNLLPQIELAYAEAGLGQLALAAEMLEALLKKHEPGNGPLTLGALHEARARVALSAQDKETCERHARAMETHYLATGISSLVALCDTFAREQRRAFAPAARRDELGTLDPSSFSVGPTTLERALGEGEPSFEGRAQRALTALVEELGETPAALYVRFEQGVKLLASLGKSEPDLELQRWAEERILQANNDDVTQTDFADDPGYDPDAFVGHGTRHRVFLLTALDSERQITVGALTFGEFHDARHFIPQPALAALAQWIHRNLTNPLTTTSLQSRPYTQE